MKCLEQFDKMCKQIVVPTKLRLNQKQIIQRQIKGKNLHYNIFTIKNQKQLQLSCLFFINNLQTSPTIIYLHGNGGSKLQILSLIKLQPKKFNYFSFDFAGCGKSQGQYITYGKNQIKDIETVVHYLKNNYKICEINIWGRSMGAVSGLLYAKQSQVPIKSMILDSPFTKLQKVLKNVANKESIPSFLFYIAFFFIKNKVQNLVEIDIFNQSFLQIIRSYDHIPVLFGYSEKDDVVLPQDVLELYQAYKGQKQKFLFQSNHSEERPEQFNQLALKLIESKSTLGTINASQSCINPPHPSNRMQKMYHQPSKIRVQMRQDINQR